MPPHLPDGSGPVWILTSLVLTGGYYGLAAHYERALATSSAASREFQVRIAVNDLTLARAATLRDQEQLARKDLGRISQENRLPRSTAELLENLANLGRLFHVRIVSLAAERESVTPSKTQENLIETPFSMNVEGDFPSLVHFIQELPRQKTLISIDGAQLAISKPNMHVGAHLTGTIRATLYRLTIGNVSRN